MAYVNLYSRKSHKGFRVYFVRYYLPGQRNKRRQFTIGNVSSRRAKEITERIRSMVLQGVDPHEYAKQQAEKTNGKSRLKLTKLEEIYLQHSSISNRPKTIKVKQDAVKRLREFVGNCYVDTITQEMIENWMTSMKVSKTSVNIYFRSIRSMFNWAFEQDFIKVNPFANGRIKQFKTSDVDPDDYFTLEENHLILGEL